MFVIVFCIGLLSMHSMRISWKKIGSVQFNVGLSSQKISRSRASYAMMWNTQLRNTTFTLLCVSCTVQWRKLKYMWNSLSPIQLKLVNNSLLFRYQISLRSSCRVSASKALHIPKKKVNIYNFIIWEVEFQMHRKVYFGF